MPIFALLGGRKWLPIAALALAAVFYIGWTQWTIVALERDVARQKADIVVLKSNLATAQSVNDSNRDTLARLAADGRARETAFGAALAAAERRCTRTIRIKQEIADAAAKNPSVCPLADSVRAALAGLAAGDPAADAAGRVRPADGSADRHEDRARNGGAPGGPAVVPR